MKMCGKISKVVIALMVGAMFACGCAYASSKTYTKSVLTGGASGSLDAIDGSDLSDGDRAIVFTSSTYYIYWLDDDSAATESSPNIISPDTNAGTKRWVLISDSDITATVGDNGEIKIGATDGNPAWATINDTTDEIKVVNDSNSITIKLADNLRHGLNAPYGTLATESIVQKSLTVYGAQHGTETILYDLVYFNSKLYACTYPGGKLLEFSVSLGIWVEVAAQYVSESIIMSMVEYESALYAVTGNSGYLLKWNGTDAWVLAAEQYGSERLMAVTVYKNKLYAGTGDTGLLLEWDGSSAWTKVADQVNSQTQIKSFVEYENNLYAGTYPLGNLFKWNDVDTWVQVAPQLDTATLITSLLVYNDEIYGGSDDGELYKWDGTSAWTEVADIYATYAGIYSLYEYDNQIFAGTSGAGNLLVWNGVDAWDFQTTLGSSNATLMAIQEFNSTLVFGTTDSGILYSWDSVSGNTAEKVTIRFTDEATDARYLNIEMNDSNQVWDGSVLSELSDVDSRDDEIDNICDASHGSGALMQALANSLEVDANVSRLADLNSNQDASAFQVDYMCDGVSATSLNLLDVANNLTASATEVSSVCDGNISSATEINKLCKYAVSGYLTTNLASVAAYNIQTFDVTVTGASSGHVYIVEKPAELYRCVITAYYSASNTVRVHVYNTHSYAVDPPNFTYKVVGIYGYTP